MIEISSSVVDGGAKEFYELTEEQTLLSWLYAHGISKSVDLDTLPMAVFINGEGYSPETWHACIIGPSDNVQLIRVPKGTDPFSITFALVFGAKAVLSALTPKLPTQSNSNRVSNSGKGLDEANAKGNKVKLNSIRAQAYGLNPARYPDFATPSRRYFAGPREQRVEMCMFVGEGRYEIPASTVKTGETPLISLGTDARYAIYQPGQDLSLDPAHLNWYPAPEVGPSSSGSPGLELTVTADVTPSATASAFTFSGKGVSIPTGAGAFPGDWYAGLVVQIIAPYPYTIADGTGTGGRDVIGGDIAQLGIPTGATIQIAGDNAGTYVVFSQTSTTMQLSYVGGSPATGLIIGDVTMAIGYPGLRYRIATYATQAAIGVDRYLENGTIDGVWTGWTARTTNQGSVRIDDSNFSGGYRGPFPACPVGELVDAIEWTVFFNQLTGINSTTGENYGIGSTHIFEYRDMAIGGAWTALSKTAFNGTPDSVGFTFREYMPYPMRPECRIKRIPTGHPKPIEIKDSSQWYSLFGLLHNQSPTSYENMTMITCDIRGGDRLSTNAENLVSLACTRILPVLRDGEWQEAQPTREISATIGQIARDVGYSDTEDLDLVELERLESTRWTPRGEYYDRILTEQGTVKSYMLEVLKVGFSELTLERGAMTFVRDEARGASFDHVYNPRVMLKPLTRNFVGSGLPDQFDGVDVEYFDHITKQNETVQCRLPGDQGTKVKKETLDGVGERYRAWRYGMRVRRAYLYRQDTFDFETELAGLNSSYFSYAGLGDSTPNRGQNAEVVSYFKGVDDVVTLGVSVNLDWSKAGSYLVVVRRRDGKASGPYTATRIDDKTFTIPALDFVPKFNEDGMMNPIIQFGHVDKWIYPAIITEVKPKGTKSCSLSAVNYDVRMFADDDNFPPA